MKEAGKESMEKTLELDLSTFKKSIYFISDLHFGHLNIIKYCNRPFLSLEQMEEQIIRKWNQTVQKDDIVFYGGDMAYGRQAKPLEEYLKQLSGKIYYVKGNHDKRKDFPIPVYSYIDLRFLGYRFRIVHNPDEWRHFKGWIIHGHHHNNMPEEFPMVNREKRTVNISCELLEYKPIHIRTLLWKIRDEKEPKFTKEGDSYYCGVCREKLDLAELRNDAGILTLFCPHCGVGVGSIHEGCGGLLETTEDGKYETLLTIKCTECGKVLCQYMMHKFRYEVDEMERKEKLNKQTSCPECCKTRYVGGGNLIPHRCSQCGVDFALLGAWVVEGKKPVMIICSQNDWPSRFEIDPRKLKGDGTVVCYDEEMAGIMRSKLPNHRVKAVSSYYYSLEPKTVDCNVYFTLKCRVPPNGEEYQPVLQNCEKCGKLLGAARIDPEDRKSGSEVLKLICWKCNKQLNIPNKPSLDMYLHRDCGGKMYFISHRNEYLCKKCGKRVPKKA